MRGVLGAGQLGLLLSLVGDGHLISVAPPVDARAFRTVAIALAKRPRASLYLHMSETAAGVLCTVDDDLTFLVEQIERQTFRQLCPGSFGRAQIVLSS